MKTLNFCLTGAAGQIAYSLLPKLCKGNVFPGVKLNLKLLDLPSTLKSLQGLAMQLQDCSFPNLKSIQIGADPQSLFKNADIIVFNASIPLKAGMKRSELFQNKYIFKEQASYLNLASNDVKCLIVANPVNTNSFILNHFAKNIKKQNITCLSRLDHNRAIAQIAKKLQVNHEQIDGVFIFGNHSPSQYPCINNITVNGKNIQEIIDKNWLQNTYVPKVQNRLKQLFTMRGKPSILSAANATLDHLKDWYQGSNKIVSMGIHSQGDYGIPKGLWSSFPVKCMGNFKYQIVKNLPLSDFCKTKINETVKDLQDEKQKYFGQ